MRPGAILLGMMVIAGCSIDFVSLDETGVATAIEVTSDHTDSVRAAVRIRHRGSVVEFVSVNDDERLSSAGFSPTQEFTFDFDLTVDPEEPVLDIRVDQHPSATSLLELRVPLLVRAGEATCSQEGALILPFELDESGTVGFRRSWTVELLDAGGRVVVSLRSLADLPRPLMVSEELVDASHTTARLSVSATGAVEDAPYDVFLSVTTGTEWPVAGLCP